MINLSQIRYTVAQRSTKPIVKVLCKTRLTPNGLTIIGFILSFGAAGAIATGNLLVGGILVLFSGAFDMLDGALARAKKHCTRFGALLDSTIDRFSEAIVLLGLLILCVG